MFAIIFAAKFTDEKTALDVYEKVVSYEFAKKEDFDEALEIAKTEKVRNLLSVKKTNEALKVMRSILDERIRFNTLCEIMKDSVSKKVFEDEGEYSTEFISTFIPAFYAMQCFSGLNTILN